MNDQQQSRAAVRVCSIADAECSRGCGTGACKREQPAAAPIDKRCVGWAILNGVCVVDFSRDRAEADRTACEMQRSHDLSGSLASFHVEPVFIRTDAAPVPAPADERDKR